MNKKVLVKFSEIFSVQLFWH